MCVPPALLTHRGETHGVSLAKARSFIGCCLATDKTLERLITTRKASVTEANDFGYTPLHFAAMADQPALARVKGVGLVFGLVFGFGFGFGFG